ncbi:MAG TPA: protein phosphatase 2C domain-containing protein [Aggregatilineaceae bacterium]|nr:protein phosphatase 2C domain-containing protein [Aggregatilineaceae bacterium]
MNQSPSLALTVRVAMYTDIGRKRKQNQDAIGHLVPADPGVLDRLGQIFVLADGVGGLTGGDLASQYAVSTIISSYYEQSEGDPPERLARAIAEANSVIFAEGQGQEVPTIMATTVVAAVIRGRELIVGSVGDSPAYLMRDADVRKLTLDHTVEAMQREAGNPLPEGDPQGRKLVRALGSQPSVKVDIITGRVRGGDQVVMCSDGLTRYAPPDEIERTAATLTPERAVKTLIQMANDRGGADNISVILLKLADEDSTQALANDKWGSGFREAVVPATPLDLGHTVMHQPAVVQPYGTPPMPPPAESPLRDFWRLIRGNWLVTIISFAVVLVAFVVVMLVIASTGGDKGDESPAQVVTQFSDADRTATMQVRANQTQSAGTATRVVQLENTQAAFAATSVALTQTPAPPSGPRLSEGMWFKVLEGDPIPAFVPDDSGQPPDLSHITDEQRATALATDETFRVVTADEHAPNGFWYLVLDASGREERWVNGPSLHQRIVAVDASANPLPADQQPIDMTPARLSPTPSPTLAVMPTSPSTSIPVTPGGSVTTTSAADPTPDYELQDWEGQRVYPQMDFHLRQTASLQGDEIDLVLVNEAALVIGGPIQQDGHWWWQIRLDDGRVGWAAQPVLSFSPVQ